MPSYSYVYWRGGRFNRISIASLLRVEQLSGLPVRVMQGGYNAGRVAASAGTHDGGGVVDVGVSGWSRATINRMLTWLRRCGWAAWYRTPAEGFIYHIHAVRIGDVTASWGAKAQVVAYRLGRNGLVSNRYDDGPRVGYATWEGCSYNPANRPVPRHADPVKPPAKLKISGKQYPDVASVSVYYINVSRAHRSFSRHTYILQCWLDRLGYHRHGAETGRWNQGTQDDLDAFRWDHHKKLGFTRRSDCHGRIGMKGLRAIRDAAGSKRKLREGK